MLRKIGAADDCCVRSRMICSRAASYCTAHIAEAAEWWQVVTGPVAPPAFDGETQGFLELAADTLAALQWQGDVWHELTGELKQATGRKGKALFLPLRQALTGRDHGPDMAALLPLIGREAAVERLRAAAVG